MGIRELLAQLFPGGHRCAVEGGVVTGAALAGGTEVSVIGTCGHAALDIPMSLRLAAHVLDTVERMPAASLVMLVDCAGQVLGKEAEMLGINGCFAHLLKCLDLARRRGHHLISLIYGEAVSGAFLSFGLAADQVYALSSAEVRVMKLSAMALITRIPEETLERLSRSAPVFAPGVENFKRLGGIDEVWSGERLAERLAAALAVADRRDRRRELGETRGGRTLARAVAEMVRRDAPTRHVPSAHPA
jgi:malonate decarboxylase gamma subunit